MRLTFDVDDRTADRLFDLATDRGVRIQDAAAELLTGALAPPAERVILDDPWETPKPPRRANGTGRDRKPRVKQPHVPLIERVADLSAERSWSREEVEQFEGDVLRLHEHGATDGAISEQTGATRSRVSRTRRRLGLPPHQQVRSEGGQ